MSIFSKQDQDLFDGAAYYSCDDSAENLSSQLVASTEVWQCEIVAQRTYSAEEVEVVFLRDGLIRLEYPR